MVRRMSRLPLLRKLFTKTNSRLENEILLFGMPLKSLCLGGRTTRWLLFIAAGSIFFIAFVYAAVVSKFLTRSDNAFVLSVHQDRYYCFLVPLTFPILVVVVYFHWLSMKLFKHA